MQVHRAISLVEKHCDIVDRIRVIPPSAQIRGVWFKAIENQLTKRGRTELYRDYFPDERHSVIAYYSLTEFLVRLACAAAIVASPERVYEGMAIVMKGNAGAFMDTLLGRVMLRVLSHDPVRLFEQGTAARRQSFSYGRWELKRIADRKLEITHTDEYCWIEFAIAGACQGTFEACNLVGKVETRLVDRFNGVTFLSW